jgi:hypothetical protein
MVFGGETWGRRLFGKPRIDGTIILNLILKK